MKGLVLLSGGLDSATVLAHAKKECEEVGAVSFDYGQRHSKEIEAAGDLVNHYDIPWRILTVAIPKGGVLLTDEKMPQMSYEELKEAQGPSPTYVPFRNGTFLSLAAALALTIDYDTLYTAVHADDGHNWAYPDCTPEFIGAMQNSIYVGTYHQVRLRAPFVYSTKAQIVELGWDLGVPFELTWSCYEGERYHCGVCPTCVSRIEAFNKAMIADPTHYTEVNA